LVAEVQEACRAKQADFMGLSFETISGVGSNAAIIHYRPTPENPVKVLVWMPLIYNKFLMIVVVAACEGENILERLWGSVHGWHY